jgi:hypothetical protein
MSRVNTLKYFTTLIGFLLIIGMIGLGGWMFSYYLWRVWLAEKSTDWTSTNGQIIYSEICEHHYRGTSYYPCLQYRYSVNGKILENDTIILAHRDTGNRETAERTVQKYSLGKEVNVYYDPDHPETACLEPGVIPWETYIPIVLGPIFTVFGLLVLWVNLHELRIFRRRRY